jgi:hypothetical protein
MTARNTKSRAAACRSGPPTKSHADYVSIVVDSFEELKMSGLRALVLHNLSRRVKEKP